VLTGLFRAMKVDGGVDRTRPADYLVDAGDDAVVERKQPAKS
jgi:hypothetical protein